MKIDGSYAMYLQLVTIIVRKNNENSLPLSSVISFFYFTLKPRSSKFLFKSIFWVDGAAEKKLIVGPYQDSLLSNYYGITLID